jgi:flagellar hook-associated protein 2
MTSSVDGLVSGLSTSSLISSLMQVEAAPRDRLKTKVTNAETVVNAYLAVNSKLLAAKTAAADVAKLETWRSVRPTSNSPSVTATATGGLNSATGTMTFDVNQLARAQVSTIKVVTKADLDADGVLDATAPPIVAPGTLDITVGDLNKGPGTTTSITLGTDRSAQGVANSINSAGIGVKASVVKVSETESILQLSGTKTGVDNAFVISGLDGVGVGGTSPVTATTAADAKITVGDPLNGGYEVTSASNTFTGLMPGVSLTASKVESGVTVTVVSDVSGISGKIQALVDAANATLSEVAKQTAYDPATKRGSALSGDFAARQIGSALLGKVSQGLGKLDPGDPEAFGTLRQLGIQLSKDGTQLEFKAGDFATAYNENPELIKKATTAFAVVIEKAATTQSAGVTAAVNGRKTLIDSMNDQIDNWAVRLTARQEALQKQYATLETSLSKLKSQSTWLSGQLAGL